MCGTARAPATALFMSALGDVAVCSGCRRLRACGINMQRAWDLGSRALKVALPYAWTALVSA